ncbi:MAG: hypothetical protein CME31_01600 [Gimesia sp.]|jgi:hypothetical protein|uniref:Uncharacterized protein n=1 Tax=Gimesia maris TaxID=122 RepID=A0A3D3RFA2_9PLAN|nr:hypothetical protein [Gimesia sp.]HCO27511.1 hypothetical protein [Gimesia maris]|tara:strand:+ start:98255 stop:98488 length:234 start_codon:yes stop_codon:yes gene_type:complete
MPFHIAEHQLIGGTVLVLSLIGLIKEQWFLANTRKGQRLTHSFGPARALWILRVIFLTGILFGGALAAGWIQPIQWE